MYNDHHIIDMEDGIQNTEILITIVILAIVVLSIRPLARLLLISTYKSQAERGDPESQFYLGRLYHNGKIVRQDQEKAMHWFKMSARKGFIPAQQAISTLHAPEIQRGVDIDRVLPGTITYEKHSILESALYSPFHYLVAIRADRKTSIEQQALTIKSDRQAYIHNTIIDSKDEI